MLNFKKITVHNNPRTELHDALGLTGAEVSINTLSAGKSVPFVHAHKYNEELYGILSGSGYAAIDGEKITLKQGDWLHIAPTGKRQFFADNDSTLTYVCIQTKAGSLEGYTATDAIIEQ